MKKLSLAIAVVAVASVLVVAALIAGFFGSKLGVTFPASSQAPTQNPQGPLNYTYKIVNTFPHDPTAFTEGLTFADGALYESTGAALSSAPSSLRRVNLASGAVLQQQILDSQYFGEGIAVVNDTIVQLTWQSHVGFVYGRENFSLLKTFSYPTEGWGLTYNGSDLIMSDGSSNLYFLDPVTFQTVGQVSVKDGNSSIFNINELEYINGDVYANIWMQQKIAIINPANGQVKAWIDLTGIYNPANSEYVLNGIAYDQANGRLFVTGKNWPNLYEIQLTPKQ
ncbi:glutaminyl-peptide cyclotransferase [Candidatus Bathyarchaeota archaeon]|nr:glutaminyl-peptide cyclotransferase [Candidatus Bathyarchaeota archaeon]